MLLNSPIQEETYSKSSKVCSDSSVVPPENASKRIKELWWLHGHPHSKRYSNPSLVSLAALVRQDGSVYQGQKGFLYPTSIDGNVPYESMTWDRFDQLTESLAVLYASQLQQELQDANSSRDQPTIALLGGGRTIEYFCTQLALQKLGVRVLLLAESNAISALHHLLKTCRAIAIITDSKNTGVDTDGLRRLDMVESLPKASIVNYHEVDAIKFQDYGDVWERHTFIIHSSGSTGMPKPIIHTNRSMMLIARMYRLFQEYSIENWFLLFPLYHIAGISIALSGLPNGQILSFPPLVWPPASSTIFATWKTLSKMGYPVDTVHCAPTLIENMYEHITENGGDFSPLSSLKILQPGGAALSDSIVNALTTNGVNVKTTYGSTEIGPPFRSIPHTHDNPRCYSFRNLYPDNPHLEMEKVAEGTYECVVHKGFELAAQLWEKSDEPYRTNDLFIQDPPGSGFYVLQGRKDDILVHSNGENTSAGPLQLDIQTSSKVIAKVLALGHSQPCVSLLVEINPDYDPSSESTKAEVWKKVQAVNPRYPGHSQVMESMIHILPKGSSLPITPKGNVKRKEAMKLYASIISRLYSNSSPTTTSSTFSPTEISDYIRTLLSSLSKTPVSEIHNWTTLYSLGINSVLALSLKSSLSSTLKHPISLSFIFENPSVGKLIEYFLHPSSSTTSSAQNVESSTTETTQRIIGKLESELKSWPSRANTIFPNVSSETILLTGTTGSLGTSLLSILSSSPQVKKIYAMVRGVNRVAKLGTALQDRGIDSSILDAGEKIEVINFSMQDPLLGLDLEKYVEVARETTVVVQNAWKMDFNLGVEEFEGDCLRNTMSLLRLTHTGRPKRFVFTSSVSTCMGPGQVTSTVPEEPIGNDPTVALSTGYAQSKYIVERITQTASSTLNIPIHLLRVGQLCGSTLTGHWNENEMWPILFASSLRPKISSIPSLPSKSVDWLPVNHAATTISQIITHYSSMSNGTNTPPTTPISSSPTSSSSSSEEKGNAKVMYTVHNLTSPNSIPWSTLVSHLRTATGTSPESLPTVSMKEWVDKISANTHLTPNELPGLKLLQFFENMAAEEEEGKGTEVEFESKGTQEISETLRGCGEFSGEWMEKYVQSWRGNGFMK